MSKFVKMLINVTHEQKAHLESVKSSVGTDSGTQVRQLIQADMDKQAAVKGEL